MLVFFSCLAGCYVLKQTNHQGNLLASRQRIDVLLWRKDTNPKLKADLKAVQGVLAFARAQGLNVGSSYSTYVEMQGSAVSYLVFAAEPDALKQKQWWFPIVGDVPYLGFFERRDRDLEAKKLKAEGFDVSQGAASAFSSLGWFDDPIYTSMLKGEPSELAHLLFHELTHRSIWMAGSVDFNENLAEFAADQLTQAYLQSRGEKGELRSYLARKDDRKLYKVWLKDLRKKLEELYNRFRGPRESLMGKKADIFKEALAHLPKFQTSTYDFVVKMDWNNATVLSSSIYMPDTEKFERSYRCSKASNIGEFFHLLEEAADRHHDGTKALDSLCMSR